MNTILVGGDGDATRVVLQDGITRYDLIVRQRVDLRDTIPEPFSAEVQHYNLFRLHPVTRAVIFAHEDLTPTQIMERLLEGYHPEEFPLDEAITTYTPMMWASMTDEQRYEEYIRVRKALIKDVTK